MVLPKSIEDAIEAEIESRVQERLEGILKMVSQNYNIKFDRLLKDLASSNPTTNTSTCCGVLKNGGKCKSKANCGNYCKRHKDQKVIPKKIPVSNPESAPPPFLMGLQNALRKSDPP
jgi:hypothetical protein